MGTLLGTAVGDALGLATEGMTAGAIRRRFGVVDRYHLLGRTGFVSDDTEQSALVATALVRSARDGIAPARALRASLVGWLARVPWGIGWGTLRACVRIALGLTRSGVRSAGNGAAMRSAIVGTFHRDDDDARTRTGRALAEVTHTDPRAAEGALYVADLAAGCARTRLEPHLVGGARATLVEIAEAARRAAREPSLRGALDQAIELAAAGATTAFAARCLGTSGFVLESVPFATFTLVRWGDDPRVALHEAVAGGGDTDTNAAIVGAWLGALHGARALPADLVAALHDGPFGRSHLASLGRALARVRAGERVEVPSFSPLRALARNLALTPVVLAHALRVALG